MTRTPSSERLLDFVHRLRQRWLWGYLLRRAAYGAVGILGWVLLTGVVAARTPLTPEALMGLRASAALVALLVVYALLLRPLRRLPDTVAFARFIEEREPRLEDRLVTAVEILCRAHPAHAAAPAGLEREVVSDRSPASSFSPALISRLIADTLAHCDAVSEEQILPARRVRLRALGAILPWIAFVLLLSFGPNSLRSGLRRLYLPWTIASPPAFAIDVKPGHVRIPRGLDQAVTATLHNFEAESARILFRHEGETDWREQAMESSGPRSFRFLFLNVQRSLEYSVVARSVRSPVFRIEVVEWPRVSRLEILYTYPAYTGHPPRRVEQGGDIAAVKGTRVRVTAHLTARVREAHLVLQDGSSLAMTPQGDASFTVDFPILKNTRYHIRVRPLAGESYVASPEYEIAALEDTPPTLIVQKPGRDLKVTAIEEVFTEARAEDDYGVALLELHYSINGGPEQKRTLTSARGAFPRAVTGSYTFFLEELNLQPGDVISYYVRARDNNTVTGPGETTSDIYFLEVRPFDRWFRQAQQAPTGQGAGENESAFVERQKEIIAATWRVLREKGRVSDEEFQKNVNTLELAQAKLREDVQTVVDRIRRRLGEDLEEMGDFGKLAEALSGAVREMNEAVRELRARRLKEALPFEQRAYQQLLRADSLFREVQVAFADRAGGGENARAQDLADLFELELDKMKNQYETIQRDRGQRRDRDIEELERRLRELAQRQQQLLEQSLRREAARAGNRSADEGRLVEEARELARQLERLTRERREARLDQVRQQLERAAQEMQRARGAQSESEAAAHRLQALEHLQAARRQLQSAQRGRLAEEIQQLRDRAQQAHQRQERIARDVERLARQAGRTPSPAESETLRERKTALAQEITRLQQGIEEAAQRARQENDRTTTSRLSAAAEALRRQRLPEQIQQGNRLLEERALEQAAAQERTIERALADLARRLNEAAQGAGSRSPNDRLAEALERARRLAENLESLRERLSAQRSQARASREGSPSEGSQPRSGQERSQAGERAAQTSSSGRPRTDEARTNPLGSRGPARDSTADATAFGPPAGRPGRDLGEALRQLRRELRERVQEAEELRRSLAPLRDLVDDASRLIAELRRLSEARLFDDPEEIERLKRQVLDPLRRLEWELARRQQEQMNADRLRLAEETAVPPQYRRLVEEYYRRLARRPNP